MHIRYELYVDDEPQDVGFMQGINELDIDDDAQNSLLKVFDEELCIPLEIFMCNRNTKSWFTESGEKKYLPHIKNIIKAFDNEGLFQVKRITKDFLENIIYSDAMQVVTK